MYNNHFFSFLRALLLALTLYNKKSNNKKSEKSEKQRDKTMNEVENIIAILLVLAAITIPSVILIWGLWPDIKSSVKKLVDKKTSVKKLVDRKMTTEPKTEWAVTVVIKPYKIWYFVLLTLFLLGVIGAVTCLCFMIYGEYYFMAHGEYSVFLIIGFVSVLLTVVSFLVEKLKE